MSATTQRSDQANTFPSSINRGAGFQSAPLSQSSILSTQAVRFQNRPSANQFGSKPISRNNIAWNNIVAVFRGRNPQVTAVGGSRGDQLASQVRIMHQRGKWEFARNGQFRFTPRGLGTVARTDLFPIVGRYNQQGNTIRFSGTRSSANLASINTSSIKGRFSLSNGRARIVQQISRATASGFGNGTLRSSSNGVVSMNMRMVRVR